MITMGPPPSRRQAQAQTHERQKVRYQTWTGTERAHCRTWSGSARIHFRAPVWDRGVLGAPAFRRAADVVAVPGLGSIVLHRAAEAGSDGRAESLGLYGDYLLQLRATKNHVWSPLSAGARR